MSDILVVDDDGDMRDALTEILVDLGHIVRTACDGREGLAEVTAHYPDVILLDIEMPVLRGPGMAYRMLVHDAGEEEMPIVLLSGAAELERVATLVGTPYRLQKPYSLRDFASVLDRALQERKPPSPSEELREES